MIEGASDKLKEHGMTVISDGTSIADDNSLTVIIDFASQEGMMNFANDEEAKAARAEAGVLLDTIVMTPITDSSGTNFLWLITPQLLPRFGIKVDEALKAGSSRFLGEPDAGEARLKTESESFRGEFYY